MSRLSKLGKLKEAVMNFEAALKLDKNTPNAQMYKDKILAQVEIIMIILVEQINSSTVKNTTNSFSTTISSVKRSAPTPPTESSKKVDIDQKLLELLKKEQKKLKEEGGITTIIDPSAVRFIVSRGYQPEFGARPIKRAIIDYIINPFTS